MKTIPDIKASACVKGAVLRMNSYAVPIAGTAFVFEKGVRKMSSRVAVMSIIVENSETVEKLNGILHEYGSYIIGRMGIPYRERKINIISIARDAPQDQIAAMAGKIGNLQGISVKTALCNVPTDDA